MKRQFILSLAALLLCSAFVAISNIIARLGLQEETAKTFILKDMIGRFSGSSIDQSDGSAPELPESIEYQTKAFQIPNASLLASIVAGDRKAAAKELCEYVKAYVTSPAFVTDYKKEREMAKPTSEPYGMDAATIQQTRETVKIMESQYETLKASNQVPAEALAELKKTIAGMKAQLATINDPTPNNTLWMKTYPEDPAVAVKARLNEYLQLLPTVDFAAKLTGTTPNNKKFANPAYEKKSLQWKAIYRAGKDVNDVASAFARDWLKGDLTAK
jgi:hypothetical protein